MIPCEDSTQDIAPVEDAVVEEEEIFFLHNKVEEVEIIVAKDHNTTVLTKQIVMK